MVVMAKSVAVGTCGAGEVAGRSHLFHKLQAQKEREKARSWAGLLKPLKPFKPFETSQGHTLQGHTH